jgi:hypothetical protein
MCAIRNALPSFNSATVLNFEFLTRWIVDTMGAFPRGRMKFGNQDLFHHNFQILLHVTACAAPPAALATLLTGWIADMSNDSISIHSLMFAAGRLAGNAVDF